MRDASKMQQYSKNAALCVSYIAYCDCIFDAGITCDLLILYISIIACDLHVGGRVWISVSIKIGGFSFIAVVDPKLEATYVAVDYIRT